MCLSMIYRPAPILPAITPLRVRPSECGRFRVVYRYGPSVHIAYVSGAVADGRIIERRPVRVRIVGSEIVEVQP